MRQISLRVHSPRALSLLLLASLQAHPALAKISSEAAFRIAAPAANEFDEEADRALDHLLENLENKSVAAGAVIASPSRSEPDYFYHWARDAALVMNTVLHVYQKTDDGALKQQLRKHLLRWVDFEDSLDSKGKLGEPKYYVDGSLFEGPWGRPQNDGPAARAITLINFAKVLLSEGQSDFVRKKLYSPELPARSLIKMNLEYTAHHWREPSFDLWEEVKGQHFYTRMVQRTALEQGALFAETMGDPEAGQFYREQVRELDKVLLQHRNFQKDLIEPTLGAEGGWEHKHSSLDVAVILGSLHASTPNGPFPPSDRWIQVSAKKLEKSFQGLYELNRDGRFATAIGRYPEDVYDGHGFAGGNPWFIATNAFAEMNCRAADEVLTKGSAQENPFRRNDALRKSEEMQAEGLSYLSRTLRHVDEDGRMSEQFSRNDGFMQGAEDLTWSYASYLTAYMACFKGKVPARAR